MDNHATMGSVGIVGGGLSGMAAAVAAVERGLRVTLFEQGRWLGGRAGSFRDPQSGQFIDFCPHVALGCCTSLADFCRRVGLADSFERLPHLSLLRPGWPALRLLGRSVAARAAAPAARPAAAGLPEPGAERWGIVRAMWRLAARRASVPACLPTNDGDSHALDSESRATAGNLPASRPSASGSASTANRNGPSSGSGPSCSSAPWARLWIGPRSPRRARCFATAFSSPATPMSYRCPSCRWPNSGKASPLGSAIAEPRCGSARRSLASRATAGAPPASR